MKCYINDVIGYYTGDRLDPADIEVTQRPTENHDWIAGEWQINVRRQALANIMDLEAQVTQRMLRESALGIPGSIALLQDIQSRIEAQRALL